MSVIYVDRITRAAIQADRTVLWVFGDNLVRRGLGGQAKECRGEINAIGIPTKKLPHMGPDAFFTDADFSTAAVEIDAAIVDIADHIENVGTVAFPSAGIGTGLANLSKSAPKIWDYLCTALRRVGIENAPEARSAAGQMRQTDLFKP